jgi:uncharacterized phage infection (PIP) family protein YhgE
MELIDFIVNNWQLLTAGGTAVLAWHKDFIMQKLHLRKGKAEAKSAEKEVDTVYIENSEKLVKLYQKSMDDLNKRNDRIISDIRQEHERSVNKIHYRYKNERDKDSKKDKEREELLQDTIKSERLLHKTVETLRDEVKKLTTEVKKLTTQLNYYRKHSNINLPPELE